MIREFRDRPDLSSPKKKKKLNESIDDYSNVKNVKSYIHLKRIEPNLLSNDKSVLYLPDESIIHPSKKRRINEQQAFYDKLKNKI